MQFKTTRARAPLSLLLGPAGSGKTDAALQRLCANIERSLLVVTSAAQAEWFTCRASRSTNIPVSDIRSRILPFSVLVNEVLRSDRKFKLTYIGRNFQRMILSAIVPAAIRQDDFFGKTLSTPGFVSAIQEGIREWKLAGATPGSFGTAATAAEIGKMPELARKLRDIERVFDAYEQFLKDNGLYDEEDSLSIAAHIIRNGDTEVPRDSTLIIVHGFYRFTGAQRNLLRAFAERSVPSGAPEVEMVVTVPWQERRPLLFAAPFRTLAQLRAEFTTHEVTLPTDTGSRSSPSEPVDRLSAFVFDNVAQPHDGALESQIFDRPIKILEAPNLYVETEMVAREFRRIHDSLHIPWSEFAILLRSTRDYAPILSAVFERYNVPVGADGPETCAENPLLKTVLTLLDVVRYGWRREDILAFLKSSYTAPDSFQVDLLRKHAWSHGIRDGRDPWLALCRGGSSGHRGERTIAIAPSIHATLLNMARVDEQLSQTPADTDHFIAVLRDIVATFGLEERIVTGEQTRIDRDKAALKEAMSAFDALHRIALLRSTGVVAFGDFHTLLCEAWANTSAFPDTVGERVCVIEPHNSRERQIRVAAVMGLTERVFPRRITEDAFMRDEERRLMREWTSIDLEEQKLRADDERFLFYQAVTAPTEHLLLSYPRAAHENDTLPSFFLDEVRAVFDDRAPPAPEPAELSASVTACSMEHTAAIQVIIRTLADVAPRPGETAMPSDDLLAACADLFDPQGDASARRERLVGAAARLDRFLRDAGCGPIVRSLLISRNLPRLPVLRDFTLRERFINGKTVFTIPELETYARCPFQYLLRHVWRLKQVTEGMDVGKQSALLHSVLRRYFRGRLERGEPVIVEAHLDQVVEDLRGILDESLQVSRLSASPHQLRILRRRLMDDLMGFAIREARFSARFETTPAHCHLSYGRAPVSVKPDPHSCPEPLVLTGADGEGTVAISGIIDRVDVDETGRRAHVVEYEIGRPPEYASIQRGESLQMPINLIAMERLFGFAGAGACYDSMQETGRRRFHRTEHVNIRRFAPILPFDDPANVKPLSREQFEELVKTAQAATLRLARAIGEGHIDARPGTHCRGCDFRDICRTTVLEGHDGERLDQS
jgi:ATP-dependent helicase/nuclease subunit B